LGHPDAAAYTADVLLHLVNNYDIDGLHLDRIRYPEFSVSGQTPSSGTNIGYNETSVARFHRRHGIPGGSPAPAQNNPLWNQWRRDQVSNLVRRVYLNAIAVKPHLKVSASLIAFGGGPTTEPGWNSAEAYWRVYQDWRAWTEEGILDIAMPMNYKREHSTNEVALYERWNEWAKDHRYNRAVVIGNGVFLNAIEGSLRQTRRALAPSTAGNSALGVIFFSMATSNVAVTGNPFSIPAGQNTPIRSFAEFAAGLTTGKSADGATPYEDTLAFPSPVFGAPATTPALAWKASPTVGHLMGFAKLPDGTPLDTATVTIKNLDTQAISSGATDGGGFYGGVDLPPGQYLVKAELGPDTLYSCVVTVTAGTVAVADLGVENVAPVTTATVTPASSSSTETPESGWYRSAVTVTLGASDNCSGVDRTEFSTDGGATWETYTSSLSFTSDGIKTIHYRSVDNAGNVEEARSLTVRIDQTAPAFSLSADPSVIWPPNGKIVPITISGSGADAVSGLAAVSYTVTDEYGAQLGIPLRLMNGGSGAWLDLLSVEARRNGYDSDGRVYQVAATLTDTAGNGTTATVIIRVPHDQRQ
jgi:hypothetical protein